jgi:predicted DNA-binding protein (MmcQ/YjbR family)
MARKTPAAPATWKKLRDFALDLPEAYEEFPWGDRVAKVRKKIFIFLGEGTSDDPCVSLKLAGAAHEHALSLPGAKPTAYNLGKAGWVTIPLGRGAHLDLLREWVETSYCHVAPKKLSTTLANRGTS